MRVSIMIKLFDVRHTPCIRGLSTVGALGSPTTCFPPPHAS